MGLAKHLMVKGITLTGILFAVLLMIVVVLGQTGLSDKVLGSVVSEEIRGLRQSLAQTIKDPEELEKVLEVRKAELEDFYGLNTPWYTRLPDIIRRVLFFDLGSTRVIRSFSGSNRVADIVLERLPNTVVLLTTSWAIVSVIGLTIGPKLALRVGKRIYSAATYFSTVSHATPSWWLAIVFILIFSFLLRIFPSGGMFSAPPPEGGIARFLDLMWHAVLPIITLSLVSVGSWIYYVMTMVLNITKEDFVLVAKARGIPENLVIRRHIVRVAAPAIVTSLILGLVGSFGGAILTETVFQWPGMGRLYFDAIMGLEESLIIALTFIFTLLYLVARFVLEILYVLLDPRVRYK